MVSRAEIYDLAGKIRGKYSYGRYRKQFLKARSQGKRQGVISDREAKELYHYYLDVKSSRHQSSVLSLERARREGRTVGVSKGMIEAEKESSFKDYRSPLLQTRRAEEKQLEAQKQQITKDEAIQQARRNLMTSPPKTQANIIAENLALKRSLPSSMRSTTISQPVKIEVKDIPIPPPKPKSKLGVLLEKVTTPIDTSQWGYVKKLPKFLRTQEVMYETLGKIKSKGEEKAKSKNKFIRVSGEFDKIRSDISKQFIETTSTPSTHLLTYGVNLIGVSAGKLPIAKKVVQSPLFQKGVLTAYGTFQGLEILTKRKTVGEAVGETGAYALSSMATLPFAQATVKIPSKVKGVFSTATQKVRTWQANRKFKAFEKSLYEKHPYKTFEKIYGSQRTLTGKSISDAKVKRALLDLNKNKLAFGIEKNTLKPYRENILGTGQTKLAKTQIIAIDKLGQPRAVRVADHKPFVYNPKLRKYVEFVSGKHKLFTIPSTFGSKIRLEQIKIGKAFTQAPYMLATTKQTLLAKIKTPKVIKLFSKTVKPKITPKLKAVKILGKGSLTYLDKSKLNVFSSKFSQAQPSYIMGTPKPPITTIKSISTKDKELFFSLPKITSQPISDKDINIQQIFKPETKAYQTPKIKPISKPITIFDIGTGSKDIQLPKSLPEVRVAQAQKPKSDTVSITKPILIVSPIVAQQPLFTPPTPTAQIIAKPPSIKPPVIPNLFPDLFKFGKQKERGSIISFKQPKQRKRKFAPTLKSVIFGERGKTEKRSIITGLGERFLPQLKKKKKKKRGKR